jgi:hypothetical protein
MNILELYPEIIVYSGLYDNPQEIAETYESNKEWRKWHAFGKISALPGDFGNPISFLTFPSKAEWESSLLPLENKSTPEDRTLFGAFYKATSHYYKTYFRDNLPNWKFLPPEICMYETNAGADVDVGMFYHTDYQQEYADARGLKTGITCTMYLNDNYEGGEICFKIVDSKQEKVVKNFCYKPKAGDILVFPSKPPYYHGVNKTTLGRKYFVRSFWLHEFEGTQDWLAAELKYGKDVWEEMEENRVQLERESGRYNLKGVS